MDIASIIVGGIVGAILGAIPSWLISWHFATRADRGLDATLRPYGSDAKKALLALSALGRMMEQAGIGRPTFDADGNLNGAIINVVGSVGLSITGHAEATVEPAPTYDRQHEQPLHLNGDRQGEPQPEPGHAPSPEPDQPRSA